MEPIWLPIDEIIETNRDVVSETGEPFAIIRPDGLEIAAAAPKNSFYFGNTADIVELAVVLLFSLARNHCFEQGNKRTALISAILFMQANGLTLNIRDSEELGELIVGVIEGGVSHSEFLDHIKPFAAPYHAY